MRNQIPKTLVLLILLLSMVLFLQAQEATESPAMPPESTESTSLVTPTASPEASLVPSEASPITASPEASEAPVNSETPTASATAEVTAETTTSPSESTEVLTSTETAPSTETQAAEATSAVTENPSNIAYENLIWQSMSLEESLDTSWIVSGTAQRVYYDAAQAQIALRLDTNYQASQTKQLLGFGAKFQFSDLANGFFVLSLGDADNNSDYRLLVRGDGAIVLLDSGSLVQETQLSISPNTEYSLKILALAGQVTVFWDEAVLMQYQDANANPLAVHSFGGQTGVIVQSILWHEAPATEDTSLVTDLFADMGSLYWGSTRVVSSCGTEHRWTFYIPNDGATQRWLVDVQPDSGNMTFGLILKDSAGGWLQNTHSSYNGRGIIFAEAATGTFYLHLTPDSSVCASYRITIWQNSIPRLSFQWTQDSYSNISRWTYYLDNTYSHSVAISRTAGNLEWGWSLVQRSNGQTLAQGHSIRGYSLVTSTLGIGDYDLYLNFDAGTSGSYNAALVQGILPPAAPLISSPANNAALSNGNFSVQLSAGAGNGRGNNFQVQADDQSNFSSPMVTTSLSSASTIPLSINLSGTIYLRGRQVDNEGRSSAWSNSIAVNLTLNDYFAQAITISSLPFSRSQSITGMTTSLSDPSNICGSAPFNTVWYKYTPSTNGILYLATNGSDYDTALAVYRGTEGALTQVACNDDDGDGLNSQISFNAIAGTSYYLLVGSYGAARNIGNLQIQVQNSPLLVPNLTSPTDNASISNTKPQFCWTAVANATRFQIEINGTIYHLGSNNCYIPSLALIQGSITWRVRALNSAGLASPWSGRNSFQVAAPLGAAPDLWRFTSDPSITFERLTWATLYHIQVASNSNFSTIVYENAAIPASQTSITLTGLGEGRYLLRIKALNVSNVWSAWGPTFAFSIDR